MQEQNIAVFPLSNASQGVFLDKKCYFYIVVSQILNIRQLSNSFSICVYTHTHIPSW